MGWEESDVRDDDEGDDRQRTFLRPLGTRAGESDAQRESPRVRARGEHRSGRALAGNGWGAAEARHARESQRPTWSARTRGIQAPPWGGHVGPPQPQRDPHPRTPNAERGGTYPPPQSPPGGGPLILPRTMSSGASSATATTTPSPPGQGHGGGEEGGRARRNPQLRRLTELPRGGPSGRPSKLSKGDIQEAPPDTTVWKHRGRGGEQTSKKNNKN